MKQQAILLADFYKTSHREQEPEGMEYCYSTWTPRQILLQGVNEVVHFGPQKFIKEYIIEYFNENFFKKEKAQVIADYTRVIKFTLGNQNPYTKHIEDLHDLGYLPLSIKSLPEGSIVAARTPVLTVQNTDPRFAWLTNYIETLMSSELWSLSTSATIAREYRKLLDSFAEETGGDLTFVPFQGHDFSMRGLSSIQSGISSGMGHLLSFTGTDTIPAILGMEEFYGANIEKELVGTSIPATEHSIACANGTDEKATFTRLLTEVYPTGFVSVVSDTWDFWGVVGTILPQLKDVIMARDGKLVIRPDSGDPVKIICGDETSDNEFARKGLVQCLWDIFGGNTNDKGYKVLDSHIGAIYGDSITRARCLAICEGLKDKGFASTNVVYGIGSYTYQYNTRDTLGYAMKATLVVINGDEKQIFKAPKTDSGVKKSQKGAVGVFKNDEGIYWTDGHGLYDELPGNLLRETFLNGILMVDETLQEIRDRLHGNNL